MNSFIISLKKWIYLFVLTFSFHTLTAQNFTHDYGKPNADELQLKRYEKDTMAEAVVIYDIGQSYFLISDHGSDLYYERKVKIKIFSKAGLKWAELSIPYYIEGGRNEEIFDLQGTTYNWENGNIKMSSLDPKNTFSEKRNEHWYNRKLAMPDVKEGSVIEISYKIKSPYLFNLRNWEFQSRIPVIFSEYTTKMNPIYEYIYVLQGGRKFDEYKTFLDQGAPIQSGLTVYHDKIYVFTMKDVPAFRDESFITSINDYIIKIDFQLAAIHLEEQMNEQIMTTWTKLTEELLDSEFFGKYIESSQRKGKDVLDTMSLTSMSTTEKIKHLDSFVKGNFNWNGYNDKLATRTLKDFISKKTGNSADINLFLAGLLKAAGIEAYPVILSTRDHGKILLDYPFQHFFDYVLVTAKTDSNWILLDATEPLCTFGQIPSRCLNGKGLMIRKDIVDWVNLESNISSMEGYFIDIHPDIKLHTLDENFRLSTTGYEAIRYRNLFLSSYDELKESLVHNEGTGDSVLASHLYEIEKPFELSYKRSQPMEWIDDKIVISPFCQINITENPLKQSVRTYPIDMVYPKGNIYQSKISIPEGYKLLSVPENMDIDNSMVKIYYTTNVSTNQVEVSGTYEFKKDMYEVSTYPALKNYFNKIVSKFNEKIVFVRE